MLARLTRALLTLIALIDLTFLLVSLQRWQLYHLHGAAVALPFVPAAAGTLILIAAILRTGWDRNRGERPGVSAQAGRDDDRFWKAGLVYVNRDDPAAMVPVRIGVGWTVNLGNPATWLGIAALVVTVAGLVVLRFAAGL